MSDSLAAELGRQAPRMFRVALRMLGNADRAQDVVQEACLRALRGLGRFDGRCALSTWLHRITVNCAIDHIQDRRRRGDHRIDVDPADLTGFAAAVRATPADAAERDELYRVALTLVEALPDDCRRAFVLTQLDGYSYDEAAEIEDAPRGTLASRVFRAKRMLADQLAARSGGKAQT